MRVAVIGLGGMGRGHLEGVLRCGVASEVVGCERDPALARAAEEKHRVRVFADLDDLLARATPRAAVVATPPAAHAANIRACFARGVAVLTEKPICSALADAEALVAQAEAALIPFQCGFQLRYAPAMAVIREAIDAGEIGTISQVSLTQLSGPLPTPGYMTRERTGGLFYEKLCHQVDLFRHLLGEPARCSAIAAPRAIGHYGIDDNCMAVFAFAGGALGAIRFDTRRAVQVDGTAKPERRVEGRDAGHFYELTVAGDRGSATYDAWTDAVDVVRYNHRGDVLSERVRVVSLRDRPSGYDMAPQDGDFLARLRDGAPPRHPARDALASMRWVEKAEESLRRGGAWID